MAEILLEGHEKKKKIGDSRDGFRCFFVCLFSFGGVEPSLGGVGVWRGRGGGGGPKPHLTQNFIFIHEKLS